MRRRSPARPCGAWRHERSGSCRRRSRPQRRREQRSRPRRPASDEPNLRTSQSGATAAGPRPHEGPAPAPVRSIAATPRSPRAPLSASAPRSGSEWRRARHPRNRPASASRQLAGRQRRRKFRGRRRPHPAGSRRRTARTAPARREDRASRAGTARRWSVPAARRYLSLCPDPPSPPRLQTISACASSVDGTISS